MAIITLTSDWGTSDYYAAAVKGVLLSKLPGATIVSSEGFSEEEKEQLSLYLQTHENEILAAAKEISNPMRWL